MATSPRPCSSPPGRICVLGSANADMYIMVDRLPFPGETRSSFPGSGDVKVGGKGLNQAVAAQLASCLPKYKDEHFTSPDSPTSQPVSFIGNVGDDTFGPLILSALSDSGVDSSFCNTVSQSSSGLALIILQKAGENSIILVGGANLTGWEDFLEQVRNPAQAHTKNPSPRDCISSSSLLLLQCEVPFETNFAAARHAKASGCGVMLDLGGFNPDDFDLRILSELVLLSANESEILSLYQYVCGDNGKVGDSGSAQPVSPEWAVGLCTQMLEKVGAHKFPSLLLVTLGGNGSVLIRQKARSGSSAASESALEFLPQRTFPLAHGETVVDTTGAGDCFRGTFAAELSRHPEDLPHCLDMASCAASLCVLKMGAMPSYPDRQQIHQRFASLSGSLCGSWDSIAPPRQPVADTSPRVLPRPSPSAQPGNRPRMFSGLSAFPLTPLRDDAVDEEAFLRIMGRLVEAKVDSITVLGSTGCYPYLTTEERDRVTQLAVQNSQGVPVFVGVGALRTSQVLQNIQSAESAGAHGLLLAPMSYQPLTEDDVFELFHTVTQQTRLPVIVYDNPGATHFTFSRELYSRIASLPGIVSFKIPGVPADPAEAKAHVDGIRKVLPFHITIGISDDPSAATGLNAGCDAWYSVIGGTLPALALKITRAAQQGRKVDATSESQRLETLWDLFTEFDGSLRVVAAIAEHFQLVGSQALPLPIQGLSPGQRRKVVEVLDKLDIGAESGSDSPRSPMSNPTSSRL